MLKDLKKMTSKEYYKKKFEEMMATEKKARDLYKYYVDRLDDAYLKKTMEKICNDEARHMEIAQTLVDLASQ